MTTTNNPEVLLLALPGPALSRILASLDSASLRALRCASRGAALAADAAFARATVAARGSAAAAERRFPRLRSLRVVAAAQQTSSTAEQRLLHFFSDDFNPQELWRGRLRQLDLSHAAPQLATPGAAPQLAASIARLFPKLVSLALPPVPQPQDQASALLQLAKLPRLANLRARGWWPLRDALVLAALDALPALAALDLGQSDPRAAMMGPPCARVGEPLARFRLLSQLPRLRGRLTRLRLGGGGRAAVTAEEQQAAAADEAEEPPPPPAANEAAATAAVAAAAAAAFALAPNIRSLTVAPLPAPPGVNRGRWRIGRAGAADGGSGAAGNNSSTTTLPAAHLSSWPASEVNAAVAALAPLSRLRHLKLLWLDEEGDDDDDDGEEEEDDDGREGRRRATTVVAPPLEEEGADAEAARRRRRLLSHVLALSGGVAAALAAEEPEDEQNAASTAAVALAAAAAAATAAAATPLPLTPETLDLFPLAALRLLSSVSVGGVVLQDGCIAALAQLPALKRLKCRGVCLLTGSAAAVVAPQQPAEGEQQPQPQPPPPQPLRCPSLTYLEVRGGGFELGRSSAGGGGGGGAALASRVFPALRRLRLRACASPAPPDLRSLAGHRTLESLELEVAASAQWDLNAALAPPALCGRGDEDGEDEDESLASLTALRRLRLSCALGSELRQWRPPRASACLPRVRELELVGAASDQTLAALPRLFPQLSRLRLERALFLTDAGLGRLAASASAAGAQPLRELELVNCPRVSEYGLALAFVAAAAVAEAACDEGATSGRPPSFRAVVAGCERLGEEACARVRRGVLLPEGGGGGGELVWSIAGGGGR